jgi:CRP/FNR family transcriptional regulator, cyclic AMP receptor protein
MLTTNVLARSPLLAELPQESLAQLASTARRRSYRRGEVIFHQGDPGDSLHFLTDGRVKVVLDAETGEEAVIAILGPGDCFGELALIDWR